MTYKDKMTFFLYVINNDIDTETLRNSVLNCVVMSISTANAHFFEEFWAYLQWMLNCSIDCAYGAKSSRQFVTPWRFCDELTRTYFVVNSSHSQVKSSIRHTDELTSANWGVSVDTLIYSECSLLDLLHMHNLQSNSTCVAVGCCVCCSAFYSDTITRAIL